MAAQTKKTPLEQELPLHLAYRPKVLDEVVGNPGVKKLVASALSKPAKPRAWLFTGPSGCGKTTLGRIVAAGLGCSERDYHELNSASYRGIDGARNLIGASAKRPWSGSVAVWLLDECHRLTPEAQDAMLKMLEEPPKHAYFIFTTTNPERMRPALVNRCAQFKVEQATRGAIRDRLYDVVEREGCPQEYPTERVLDEISRRADGSMRQALVMLDQVIDVQDEGVALDALQTSMGSEYDTKELCRALLKRPTWAQLSKMVQGNSSDPESLRLGIVGYMTTVLLGTEDPENGQARAAALAIELLSAPGLAFSGKGGLVLALYQFATADR